MQNEAASYRSLGDVCVCVSVASPQSIICYTHVTIYGITQQRNALREKYMIQSSYTAASPENQNDPIGSFQGKPGNAEFSAPTQ